MANKWSNKYKRYYLYIGDNVRGTLNSHHETCVDFDKIYVFCAKCCVRIDKCMFIIVKIKCVNSGRISDICDKVNFTSNYIHCTTLDNILSKHTQKLQFLTPLAGRSCRGPKNLPLTETF